MSAAETISSQLAKCGINIISGLASGIDTAAHKGAVNVKGTAVGVLGCGIDIVYPLSNRKLYESVLANDGMILTEFPPGTEPLSKQFSKKKPHHQRSFICHSGCRSGRKQRVAHYGKICGRTGTRSLCRAGQHYESAVGRVQSADQRRRKARLVETIYYRICSEFSVRS